MLSIPVQKVLSSLDGVACSAPNPECILNGVTATAEAVRPGNIFVAIRGFAHDGHTLVEDAFARGAALCVVQDLEVLKGRPGIAVSNTRRALSRLAALFHDDPSAKLQVVGITGTNGKTTTNWIVYHVLNALGWGALRIGTLGTELMGRETEAGSLTSPDALSVQGLMSKAVAAGAKGCVMEASSHALDQARVEDVAFDVGVFTNLTRDHLDYHKTFEAYFEAKSHLFDLVAHNKKAVRVAVINADDQYGVTLIEGLVARGIKDLSFGRSQRAAIRILDLSESPTGMKITLSMSGSAQVVQIQAPFIGLHNAENVTAAFGACVALGYAPEAVATALRTTPQVPGRLERVGQGKKRVFVDYAHTPDALERVISAVRPSTTGKLWVVFGCGGDRDRGKRPQMARVAAQGADHVVVTSDNPRTEKPEAIIGDILSGGVHPTLVDVDRRRAITATLQRSAESDTVLIAGKGHEDYQIIGTEKIYFSDQAVAREALENR